MKNSRDTTAIRKQYETDQYLSTRISLHKKYSTNRQGFETWIFSQFEFQTGCEVLEIGCGTGSLWKGQALTIEACRKIVLSDLSEGMLRAARDNIGIYSNVEYKVIDANDIPFENETFDIIIANMMLYYVPDLHRTLSEISRTLKSGGRFYCATFGENGLTRYVNDLLQSLGLSVSVDSSFTLQNGKEKLASVFSRIERLDYPDSFEITDSGHLAQYILSMTTLMNATNIQFDELVQVFENRKDNNGVIKIPKEDGMFIAKK